MVFKYLTLKEVILNNIDDQNIPENSGIFIWFLLETETSLLFVARECEF